MNSKLLSIGLIAASATAHAGVNSPENAGYLTRGRLMYEQANYIGCIDQLSALDRDRLSDAEREKADWLLALAAEHTSGSNALGRFRAFAANYPASVHREDALTHIADCLLASDPAAALAIYTEADADALPGRRRTALIFHKAYAQIMTGQPDAALPAMESLANSPEYGTEARYYAGYIYYCRHDYAKAVAALQTVPADSHLAGYASYYLAQIAYSEADYRAAAELARQLTARTDMPEFYRAESYRILGEALFNEGKRSEGAKALNTYTRMTDSPALSALYLLGLDEYRKGDLGRAVSLLEPVTKADDAMAQTAYLYIGEALMSRGDKDAAILAFDNARKMDYDSKVQEAALYNYAVARFGGASVPFASGVAIFEEYLRRYPDGAYAPAVQEYIVKGYLTEKNYEGALESISRMRDPSQAVLTAKQQILYALGSRTLAAGNTDKAAGYLEQAAALSRYNSGVAAQTALALGEARYRQGRYSDAVRLLNDYLRSAPASDTNHALARYDLGYARLALKDYADAAVNFDKVVQNPGNLSAQTVADALNRLADTYYYRSDWATAARYYDRAYQANPEAGDYSLFQQAVMLGYSRDHKGKIDAMKRMMRQFPSSSLMPDALLEITESYQQLGRTDDAIATYRRLVSEYPATSQGRRAYLQLALTQLNTGHRAEAIETYRDVIRLYPTSEEAAMAADELKQLAAADGTLGDFASFLASVDNAPKLDVAEADRLDFDAAERIWIEQANPARLERYLAQYPAGAFRPKALAYLTEANANQPARALEFASQILTAYPDSPQAEDALKASAEARYSLGMGDEALADWQALEQRASSPAMLNAARAGIMRTARDMGRADLMLRAADALLASSTLGAEMHTEATFTRALALRQEGKIADARKAWESIAGDTDDIYGTKAAFSLAESWFRETPADRAKARAQLEKLIDSATPHTYWLARAFILLSDVYAAEGRTFEAREYLRSLRQNYPGNEPDIMQMIDSRLDSLK